MRLRNARYFHVPQLFALLLVACDRDPTGGLNPGDIDLKIVSGNHQESEVGEELPWPLIAWITNPQGKSVRDVVVTFHVVSGGGSVFSGAAKSNEYGLVYEYWTLGSSTSEPQELEVRAVDPATGQKRIYAKFTATPRPGAPASLSIHASPGDSYAGLTTATPPAVLVQDRFGNPVPDVTVRFEITGGDGSVELPNAPSGHDGVSTPGTWILGPLPGENTLRATVPGLDAIDFAATGNESELIPARIVIVSGDGQTTHVARDNLTEVTVRIEDRFGNPIYDVGVHSDPSDVNRQFWGPSFTDREGSTTVAWEYHTAGTYTENIYVGRLSTTVTLHVIPGAAWRIEKAPSESEPYRVQIKDMGGNGVPGVTVVFSEYRAGDTKHEIATIHTDSSGYATLPSWSPTSPTSVLSAFSSDGFLYVETDVWPSWAASE